jgi:fatty-acyl-CoA synthase
MFHSWGFAHFTLGMLLNSTFVLRRKFDPEDTLATIEKQRPTTLAVVPVMMQRIMELPESVRRKYDTSSLRVVAVSGSALPGELATKFMDEFGDIVYNLYGSTEVAWATIATPRDLRLAPGTAGKPPWNTTVRLFDQQNQPVQNDGDTGRIFVNSGFEFEGYTGGVESKAQIGGLMSTGDVGHFDEGGRLFVEGRDDEMIVSGGENVFPREIEDLIAGRKEVSEVAVIGVKDPEFGQRLKAFVVLNGGAKLTEDEVKNYVKSNTARFKVPREVEFIKELPRNTTGKVLKRELVEQESGKNGASADADSGADAEKTAEKTAKEPDKTPAKKAAKKAASTSRKPASAAKKRSTVAKKSPARRTRAAGSKKASS